MRNCRHRGVVRPEVNFVCGQGRQALPQEEEEEELRVLLGMSDLKVLTDQVQVCTYYEFRRHLLGSYSVL